MPSRRSSPRKKSRSNDATLKDVERGQNLVLEARKKRKGTTLVFDELEDVLGKIREDYEKKTGEGIGRFRLREKRSHQQIEKDYTLTTITAVPEEVVRKEGKIIEKNIPKDLEFIITIKTALKDGKKDIQVSVHKPETSQVDLGKDIEIICGGQPALLTSPLQAEEERFYKEMKQIKKGGLQAPPKAGESTPAQLQIKVAEELKQETAERRIRTDILTNLDSELSKAKIEGTQVIETGKELAERGNKKLAERGIKNVKIVFNDKKSQLEFQYQD